MRLAEALEQTATAGLRRIAAAHALPHDEAATRAELLERIAERLTDRSYLGEQLETLPEHQRKALLAARDNGGQIRGFLIERDTPGVADELVERGLLFRTFAAAGPRRGEMFAIPDEILASLPAAPAVEPPPTVEAPDATDRRSTDPAFNLFILASSLQRGADLEPEVRHWAVEPGGYAWDARWKFLQHLAQAAGLLVTRTDGHLVGAASLTRLLSQPGALHERLWRTYVHDHGWSDLVHAGIDEFFGVPSQADVLDASVDAALVRTAVVERLERLPPGTWSTVDSFSAWLRRTSPDLVREQLDTRGRLALESKDWSQVELRLLRSILSGPLYWLAKVSLTADGAQFALRDSPARDAPPEPCTWSAESMPRLIAPARCDLGRLLQAERYLVLHERGRRSSYRLVQQHVAAALGGGGSIHECRTLLLELTQQPLPDAVEERLNAWRERFGALSIRPTVVVEASTEAELGTALADAATRQFIRRLLGPAVAEVQAADALDLAAALRESGHLPRVDAALRLDADPRRAYGGLVDEQVLEFLLVSLLAFQLARPERLAELEGAPSLIERLEGQFARERLAELRAAAGRLAGELASSPPPRRRQRTGRGRRPTRRRTARLA